MAEGVEGGAFRVAEQLKKLSRNEYRVCILGHLQRGGSPTAADRCLAARLGAYAVKAVRNGDTGKMVGEVGGRCTLTPFRLAVKGKRRIEPLYGQMMRFLGL